LTSGTSVSANRLPEPARLIVVDDNDFVREGIKLMLSGEQDLRVVGEAADGREALELCRRTRPELVLMDVRMPRMDGLAATREIKQRFPEISVMILTMYDNEDYLLEAVRAGAAGYVLKDAPQRELATALRKVLEGETTLNRGLATRLLQRIAEEPHEKPAGDTVEALPKLSQHAQPLHPLTPREIEVLEGLALGKTNREIAEDFVISVGTVKNHVEHIMAKLGVSDRTQAVVRSLELGIIEFPNNRG
jgi:two-component system, NarL family, response regulator DegU